MAFLLNAWYVAGFSPEVRADHPLGRRLLGTPVVMFRDANGSAVMLDDRCPHRFAPLSRGRISDGAIECPYHGLRIGALGNCVHNPHGDGRTPQRANVRCYPVMERFGAIWFWPGDPAASSVAPLPEYPFLDHDTNLTHDVHLLTRANYQLGADNLLDLSHLQFLHPDSLGSGAIAGGKLESGSAGNSVWVRRMVRDETLPAFVAQGFGVPPGTRVDRWMNVYWIPPGLLTIMISVTPAGQPRESGLSAPSAHWFTPETDTSTHYFFAFGLPRSRGEQAAGLVRYAVEGLMKPFEQEDLPMLEAQQERMGSRSFWEMNPALLSIDAGPVRARRIMDRLIEAQEKTQRQPCIRMPRGNAWHPVRLMVR